MVQTYDISEIIYALHFKYGERYLTTYIRQSYLMEIYIDSLTHTHTHIYIYKPLDLFWTAI